MRSRILKTIIVALAAASMITTAHADPKGCGMYSVPPLVGYGSGGECAESGVPGEMFLRSDGNDIEYTIVAPAGTWRISYQNSFGGMTVVAGNEFGSPTAGSIPTVLDRVYYL